MKYIARWRKAAVSLVFMLAFSQTCEAKIEIGDDRIGLNLGVGIPTSANDFSDTAKVGFSGGVDYLHQITNRIGIGGRVQYFSFPGDDRRLTLTGGGVVDADSDSTVLLGEFIGRMTFCPSSGFSPYVRAGIGLNRFSQKTDAAPIAGVLWLDTSTNETRRLTDDSSTGVALSFGGGVEFSLSEVLLLGLEGNWHIFGVDEDDYGTDFINVPSVLARFTFQF